MNKNVKKTLKECNPILDDAMNSKDIKDLFREFGIKL